MHPTAPVLLLFALVVVACEAPRVSVNGDTDMAAAASPPAQRPTEQGRTEQDPTEKATNEAASQQAKKSAEQDPAKKARQQQRELQKKRREVERLALAHRVAELERRGKQVAARAAHEKAEKALVLAKSELEHFLGEVRPREIEEHQIRLDRATHRADHAKDEFDELTAMYEADEFAKATKELVLKRGRRSQEMAARDLAVTKRKLEAFRKFELPKRETDLRQKVADAERAVQKAAFDLEKLEIEFELARLRERDKVSDLEAEIAELVEQTEGKS